MAVTGHNWDAVSDDAKHCIKRMLVMKPSKRATAQELLQEKWFRRTTAAADQVSIPPHLHLAMLAMLAIHAATSRQLDLAFHLTPQVGGPVCRQLFAV